MIFRIINGEKKLFAEVNKLEAVNFKKYTGNKTEDNLKNLVLDASNIPFDLAEVTTVDKDWNVDSEGDSRGLSVRDYIDDLRDDLAELDERTNNLDYVRMDRIAIQGGHTRKALLNALAVGVDSPAKPTEITITQFTSFVDDAAGHYRLRPDYSFNAWSGKRHYRHDRNGGFRRGCRLCTLSLER